MNTHAKEKPARRSARLRRFLGLNQATDFRAPRRNLLETRRSILKKLSTRMRQGDCLYS